MSLRLRLTRTASAAACGKSFSRVPGGRQRRPEGPASLGAYWAIMPAVAARLGLRPLLCKASFSWSTSVWAAPMGMTIRPTTTLSNGQAGSEWSQRADSNVMATVPPPIDRPQQPVVKVSGACGLLMSRGGERATGGGSSRAVVAWVFGRA